MIASKPVLVFVHGACMPPVCYAKTTDKLRAAGFDVVFPELPSLNGAKPPDKSLPDDTALIKSTVEKLIDAGNTVVAVLHSYGGQVGTGALTGLGVQERAAKGLKGGVSHIIYIAATMGLEGTSMMDKVEENGHAELLYFMYNIDPEDKTLMNSYPREQLIGEHDNEDEAKAFLESLKNWNGNAIWDRIEGCAWREIPATYIHTSEDIAFPMAAYQATYVKEAKKQGVVVATETLKSGHSPFFTNPDEVVAIIRRIAES
ncbi:alpha/beta-hydrolase [Xylariaceae sp. FL0255]|nr:alpha/beta-hydrolase [Xylariaceae sp. FL0255]